MKRSGEGDYYERLWQRELPKLPSDIRFLWDEACKSKILTQHPGIIGECRCKSLRRSATSTKTRRLCDLNKVISAAQNAGMYDQGLRGLLEPDRFAAFLENGLKGLSGISKWNICRSVWRMAWEFYRLNAPWILIAGRRWRALHVKKTRQVNPDLREELLRDGERLMPEVTSEGEVTLRLAIKFRTAAHMAVVAQIPGRSSEVGLMDLSQISRLQDRYDAQVNPKHSKMGKGSDDPVCGFAVIALDQYLKWGRPFLLERKNSPDVGALWITTEGVKAEAGTMAGALRRATRSATRPGITSGDVRRTAASQPGQSIAERGNVLKHNYGSRTAQTKYTNRDRSAAVEENARLSTIVPADVPIFVHPMPRRSGKKRR